MSSRPKSLLKHLISYSLILISINLAIAFIFLNFISSHFYRERDHQFLKTYSEAMIQDIKKTGYPKSFREEFLWVRIIDKNEVVFQQFPRELRADEMNILRDISTPGFGYHAIDLSTLEDDDTYWDQLKSRIVTYLMQNEFYLLASILNDDFFDIYVERIDEDKILMIGRDTEDREEMLEDLRYLMAFIFLPVIFLSLILSFLLGRKFLRPIKKLAADVSQGKVKLPSSDTPLEIQELQTEFHTVFSNNEKLIQSLKDTLDNLAHDLKTPLTHIKINAERGILSDEDAEALKNRLGENAESAETILKILKSLMDVKEAHSGSLYLNKEVFDLSQLMSQVMEMYSDVASEKNLQVLTQFQDLKVLADKARLYQVFANLIDNAIKFSPPNSTLKLEIDHDKGQMVCVKITDEGEGIAEKDLPFIFERLYRADSSRSTPGFGIGLSLVKAFVQAHQGSIKVESKPSVGSCFVVSLPICHLPEKD